MDTALATLAPTDIVLGDATPVPIFSGTQMAAALVAYRDLQQTLDRAMPDQIMTLDGKLFRKKGYWRAVAVAFNLTVEPTEERREVVNAFDDGRENFGFYVTYRATAGGGRAMSGDGACFAIEKAPRRGGAAERWREQPFQATEHNVRSHAHTRAFNRAVSNLVGFGEVSAEEVERDEHDDDHGTTRPASRPASADTGLISDPQRKRMYAIAKGAGWADEQIKAQLATHGFEHSSEVTRAKYEALCATFGAAPGAAS